MPSNVETALKYGDLRLDWSQVVCKASFHKINFQRDFWHKKIWSGHEN